MKLNTNIKEGITAHKQSPSCGIHSDVPQLKWWGKTMRLPKTVVEELHAGFPAYWCLPNPP